MRVVQKVSIVILVHGALKYCKILFDSISKTKEVDYEIIVVDNNSKLLTKIYLYQNYLRKKISRLCFVNENTFFAEGNNIGVHVASRDSTHILLLNSDVKINYELWLRRLLNIHKKGATAYGYVDGNPWSRADGYCFLINKELYLKYQLDEDFQWFWSLTKLQSKLLQDGYLVQAIKNHDEQVYHFGGRSGDSHKKVKINNIDPNIIINWFNGKNIKLISSID